MGAIQITVINDEPSHIEIFVQTTSETDTPCGIVVNREEEREEVNAGNLVLDRDDRVDLKNGCEEGRITITVSKGEECIDWWSDNCFQEPDEPEVKEKASAKPILSFIDVNGKIDYETVPYDISTPDTQQFTFYDMGRVLVGEDDFVTLEIQDYVSLKALGWTWHFGACSTSPLSNSTGLGGGGDVIVISDTNAEGESTGTFTFNVNTGVIRWYIGHDNVQNSVQFLRLKALDPRADYVLSDYGFMVVKTMLLSHTPVLTEWSNQNMGHLENVEIGIMNYYETAEYSSVEMDLRFTIPKQVNFKFDRVKKAYLFTNPVIINNNGINEVIYIYAKEKYKQRARSTGFQMTVEKMVAQPKGFINLIHVKTEYGAYGNPDDDVYIPPHTTFESKVLCGIVNGTTTDCVSGAPIDDNRLGFNYYYYFTDKFDPKPEGEKEEFAYDYLNIYPTENLGWVDTKATVTLGCVVDPEFQIMAKALYINQTDHVASEFRGYRFFNTFDQRAYPYSVVSEYVLELDRDYDRFLAHYIIAPIDIKKVQNCPTGKCQRIRW